MLLCVVREKGKGGTETIKVCPELAATAPPTMAALTFLQAWATDRIRRPQVQSPGHRAAGRSRCPDG